MSDKVECPHCKEPINPRAWKCPHCHEQTNRSGKLALGFFLAIGGFFGMIALGAAVGPTLIKYWLPISIFIVIWLVKPALIGWAAALGGWWLIALFLPTAIDGFESLNSITEHSLWKEYGQYAHWVIFFTPVILIAPLVLLGASEPSKEPLSEKGESEDKKSTPSG